GGQGGPFELRSPNGANDLDPIERAAVIAFLSNALTDPRVAASTAPFDRPTLYSEMVPFGSTVVGPATVSGVGWQPLMIDNVPPLVEKVGGPNWWKIGVGSHGAFAGTHPIIPPTSTAMLFVDPFLTGGGPFWLSGGATMVAMLPTTAQGFATAQQPVPLSTALIGSPSHLQWIVQDPGGWVGWSEAVTFVPL